MVSPSLHQASVARTLDWGCPHRPVLGLRPARFLPPPNSVLATEAAAARGMGAAVASLAGAVSITLESERSTLASRVGIGPSFARGARCAPRPSRRALHGGGASRSLRHCGCARPDADAGGSDACSLTAQSENSISARAASSAAPLIAHRFGGASRSALEARQLGVQFRPEVLLGRRFIVDFFASRVGIVVEVDGGSTRVVSALTRAAIASSAVSATACFAWKQSSCFEICRPRWH